MLFYAPLSMHINKYIYIYITRTQFAFRCKINGGDHQRAHSDRNQTTMTIQTLHRIQHRWSSDERGEGSFLQTPLSQRRDNAWIISLFIFLHSIAFTATMFVNYCWHNSHRDCALQSLRRFSFQPLRENPLLGPSASAWVITLLFSFLN